MALHAYLRFEIAGNDGEQETVFFSSRRDWTPAAGTIKRESVSLTGSAFTALSPPTSAKFVCILPGTAVSLTLKGVTGDTGVVITPASNPLGVPVILPLGASPSIGITNGGSTITVDLIWL